MGKMYIFPFGDWGLGIGDWGLGIGDWIIIEKISLAGVESKLM